MNELKEFWQALNKFYFCNCAITMSVLGSILIAFFVQFQVENLQDEMTKTQAEIASYQDKINLMEVEWTYLTRPERLRSLAALYLKDNGYTLASQIKETEKLEKYYLAIYQNSEAEELVANPENKHPQQVSF